MEKALASKVRKNIVTQLDQLLDESWRMIEASMDRASTEASMAGKERFKFPVSMKATIEPFGEDCRVDVSVSWGTRCKLNSEAVTVSTQPELTM
jgi:hypothetical protein